MPKGALCPSLPCALHLCMCVWLSDERQFCLPLTLTDALQRYPELADSLGNNRATWRKWDLMQPCNVTRAENATRCKHKD